MCIVVSIGDVFSILLMSFEKDGVKEYLNSLQERSKWHNELKNAVEIIL